MNVDEQQTVDNYEIDICEFEEVKDIDPVSKRKTLGCWGPSPDDGYNQC